MKVSSQYKGHKGKGTAANVHGDLLEKGESSTQSGPASVLSQEQYHHLVSMLQQFKGGNMGDGSASNNPVSDNASANFAV